MCGRYSYTHSAEKTARRFGVKVPDKLRPRYNAAPTQDLPVITNKKSDELFFFRWGLIPNWSLDESSSMNLINAKAETILTKSPFKQCIRSQRCLIPADGFYEWEKKGKLRIPHRITLSSDEIFSFAGVWDSWENKEGEIINSFTIITTDANELVKAIHERMPVILPKEHESLWLSAGLSDKDITDLLRPYDSNRMNSYAVHKVVNSPDLDIPQCIQPAPKIYPGETYKLFE